MLSAFISFLKLYKLTEARKMLRTWLARSPESYSERPRVLCCWPIAQRASHHVLCHRPAATLTPVKSSHIYISDGGAKHSKAKCINFGQNRRRPQTYVGRGSKFRPGKLLGTILHFYIGQTSIVLFLQWECFFLKHQAIRLSRFVFRYNFHF